MRFAAIRSLLAFLSLLLATAVLTVSAPSVAGAATASLAKGRAAYAYDTPPLISAPIATVSYVEGAWLGDDLASWGSSVSARGFGVAANTGRGLNEFGGVISQTGTNAAGGRVFTSTGTITQNDFRGIVNGGLMRGDDVHILTGTHGLPDGSLVPDASLFADDVRAFGNLPGVTVHDLPDMSPVEVSRVLISLGTIIGGFCNSGACLAGR